MKRYQLIILGILSSLFFSCQEPTSERITNVQDYQEYLNTNNRKKLTPQLSNLQFWTNKYETQPNQYPYLTKIAAANTALFQTTGNIDYLINAEKNLLQEIEHRTTASNLRALAKNYISQHRFQESLQLLKKAETLGEKQKQTDKMLFDVYLEIGDYEKAEQYLNKIRHTKDFDYLIRAGKWNDVHGNLETAISFLERALVIAKSRNSESLLIWSYSNLADFYGHHNQLKKSYAYYLKTLALDPGNAYAKKGIAWIAYSHENNSQEAMRILNSIQEYYQAPDHYLFKAELAEYENNPELKEQNLTMFLFAARKQQYGRMYDQHATKLYLDEYEEISSAVKIIQEEIENRPTPEIYDLLAWSHFKNGEIEESMNVAKAYVIGKSHEPEVLYHLAEIYKANGMHEEAQKLKKELLESAYEIGPVALSQVQKI
jgi:hypothetical protein